MRRIHTRSGRSRESGIVILLVAVVLLFVVGAMAALAIDVVTLYTARSEAQLAADGAALAGARVLANSGMTSDPNAILDGLASNAENLAIAVARQVAMDNDVGGRTLLMSEVNVSFNDANPGNPRVTVKTQRADLPTFFARIWGNSVLTVSATATAEAYNPSGLNTTPGTAPPIAPACVKPWLLPNIDPTSSGAPTPIFDPVAGTISNPALLGYEAITPPSTRMSAACATTCSPPPASASSWQYYPGDPGPTNFPPPSATSVACAGSAGFTPYQLSVAGCVQTPIACNQTVNVDTTPYPTNRDLDAAPAVNCLAHSTAGNGDTVDNTDFPIPPFRFVAGADNPVVQAGTLAAGTDVFVSSSLVTVPVFDSSTWPPPTYPTVQIVGFVQLFLQPDGTALPTGGGPNAFHISTKVINLVGCGTGATGQPILGNGASAVPVRLVTTQ